MFLNTMLKNEKMPICIIDEVIINIVMDKSIRDSNS